MADSTAPAVKAYLLSLFRQQAALTGVNVEWAAPIKDEDYTSDIIWLGDVDPYSQEFLNLGAGRVEEEYDIEITAQAYVAGNDPQFTEERAWTLRASIVTALRADKTLGGTVNKWTGPYPGAMSTRPASPNGWLALTTVRLTCRASI